MSIYCDGFSSMMIMDVVIENNYVSEISIKNTSTTMLRIKLASTALEVLCFTKWHF